MARRTHNLFPTTITFTVYANHRCRRRNVVDEEAAVEFAHDLWLKSNHQAEVTIVSSGPTGIQVEHAYHPACAYFSGAALAEAMVGRMISWVGPGGEGERRHHLNTRGESRLLDRLFGEVDALIESGNQAEWFIERRKDATGKVTIVGRSVDVRILPRPLPMG